jgi:phosphoadenosine phosphosulfate reductase
LPSQLSTLDRRLEAASAAGRRVALAFSLQIEDMLLLHVAQKAGRGFVPVVLDTGRLHRESLDWLGEIELRYGFSAVRMRPEPHAVGAFAAAYGHDGFYDSLDARKTCCRVRKVEPLARALAGFDAWVTGQRRDQAQSRTDLPLTEHDAERGLAKHNPLADWTTRDVWAAARSLGVPANPLYARGFASIGCDPCTRPIRKGEDERAGRWWWEQSDTRECGLHTLPEARP